MFDSSAPFCPQVVVRVPPSALPEMWGTSEDDATARSDFVIASRQSVTWSREGKGDDGKRHKTKGRQTGETMDGPILSLNGKTKVRERRAIESSQNLYYGS